MSKKLLFATPLLGAIAVSAPTQPASTARCLHGQAIDSTGTPLSTVAITVSQAGNNIRQTATTTASGQFDVCGLQPGSYQVSAHKSSYQDSNRIATVQPGADASLTLVLPGNIAQAQAPAMATGEFHAGIAEAEIPDAPTSANKNLPHGNAYGFLGSVPLNMEDVILRDQLPIAQYGASIGGSIGSGRTSYFLSFDQFALSQPKLLSLLNEHGPVSPEMNPLASSTLTTRLDHKFGERDTASLRFNRDDLHSYALLPGTNGNNPTLQQNFKLEHQQATASNTVTLSPNTTNETQVQYIASKAQLPAGAPTIGIQSDLPTERRDRVFEAANNIYKQIGTHSLRVGGDFLYNQMNITFLESSLGRASGNSFFSQSGRDAGLYVEAQHRLRANLVATTGIRYDLQSLQGFKRDVNNVSPQLGLAWSPSSRTVIRGGFDLYYDQVPLPAIAGAADSTTAANIQESGRFVSRNGRPAYDLASFTTLSPTMQNSYAETANFAVDQQIGARSALTAETQYVRGVQLALPVMRSTALCASSTDCNSGNSFFGREIGSGAVSTYTGSTIAFTQDPTHWGNYKIAYTYSDARGDGMAGNASSVEDRMRRLSFTGGLHTSAEPGTNLTQRLTHGFALTGTGDYIQRSEFLGMNFFNFNARLSKVLTWGQHYRLEALAETFNMFQQANASLIRSEESRGEDARSIFATYRQLASFQSPTGSQLGLRLTF